jgi:glycosyltransferase involved in cell wall biosynthesis
MPSFRLAVNGWFHRQLNTGSGQYLRYLLPALLKHDPDLHIDLLVPDEGGLPGRGEWPEPMQVHLLTVPPGNLGKLWFEQVTFPRQAKKLGADVAHVPYFGSAWRPGLPTLVTVHDLIPVVLPAYRGGALVKTYTKLVSLAAQRASFILADSDASRSDIFTHLQVQPAQVQTVYLAQAPQYKPVRHSDRLREVRQKYGLPEHFVLYMGGFDVRKNVINLVRAWAKVLQRVEGEAKLVLAGRLPTQPSNFFPDPLAEAQKLGVGESLITPGWIDEEDKAALYSAALCFVYPSLYEGFGLPVLEAMACGTPVVTSNRASLPELAGLAAPQVDPDSPAELAEAIVTLLTNPHAQRNARQRGLEQAAKFTWAETAAQTHFAYRTAIRQGEHSS